MLVFFTNISPVEFQDRYFALFSLFSVIDCFQQFWMESPLKNIQLMQEFFKALLLVLHFSYYTLMNFLMMLSVILLSMLIILLSTTSVIKHLICGNNQDWLLNFNLIYETLWTGTGSNLLISLLEKLNWFRLTGLNNTDVIDVKMNGSVLQEKSSFNKMLGLTFSSKLDWGSYIISIQGGIQGKLLVENELTPKIRTAQIWT